ncbi:MAG: hypothetical protein NTX50_14260 [Candidatus Sumerlaeota bacterium]|nr:hypothetical protein [Candidatus Sumerlaeota bacterium]
MLPSFLEFADVFAFTVGRVTRAKIIPRVVCGGSQIANQAFSRVGFFGAFLL